MTWQHYFFSFLYISENGALWLDGGGDGEFFASNQREKYNIIRRQINKRLFIRITAYALEIIQYEHLQITIILSQKVFLNCFNFVANVTWLFERAESSFFSV